jgi:hypothetical protein
MHNIRTNFSKFYGICKELFENDVNSKKNFQFYPVKPKMNDLEIVALACCMEVPNICCLSSNEISLSKSKRYL